jgi:hypothetical protein
MALENNKRKRKEKDERQRAHSCTNNKEIKWIPKFYGWLILGN